MGCRACSNNSRNQEFVITQQQYSYWCHCHCIDGEVAGNSVFLGRYCCPDIEMESAMVLRFAPTGMPGVDGWGFFYDFFVTLCLLVRIYGCTKSLFLWLEQSDDEAARLLSSSETHLSHWQWEVFSLPRNSSQKRCKEVYFTKICIC